MFTRLSRPCSAFFLAVAVMFLCQSGNAQAHPQLIGTWSAPVPPGGSMVYEFGPARYIGNGYWIGTFQFSVAGCVASTGEYELYMFTGIEGTIKIKDTYIGCGAVGIVNFAVPDISTGKVVPEMIYKNVLYRR